MTITACLQAAAGELPVGLPTETTLRWLSELEGRVAVELLGESPEEVTPLTAATPTDTELSVPHPYDRLYPLYLVAMSDLMMGDVARYANTAALFNEAYRGYGKWLKRRGV